MPFESTILQTTMKLSFSSLGLYIQQCPFNEGVREKAQECCDELDALYNDIKIIPAQDQYIKLKSLLSKGERLLGPTNISLIHCYEVAMDGSLEYDDWKGALEYGTKLETPYLVLLPENHPTIGLHYFKLGEVLYFIFCVVTHNTLQKCNENAVLGFITRL